MVLLAISAAAELFGTITVWSNYRLSARAGALLLSEVQREDEQDAYIRDTFHVQPFMPVTEQVQSAMVQESAKALRSLRREVGEVLRPRWYLTAGLYAYVIGAIAGLTAGLLALSL